MLEVHWIVYQIYNAYDFKRLKTRFNYQEFILDNEEQKNSDEESENKQKPTNVEKWLPKGMKVRKRYWERERVSIKVKYFICKL